MNMNDLGERTEEPKFLTYRQARDAFIHAGLSETTLSRRVGAGDITPIMPPGRQRGAMYPEDQVISAIKKSSKSLKIDAERAVQSVIAKRVTLKPATYGKATVEDIPAVGELLRTFFNVIHVDKRKAWIERNPQICSIVKSEGKIVACGFIMPIVEEKILKILNSRIKPPTRSQDIAPSYERGEQHYCVYLRSVVALQNKSVPRIQSRYWGAILIAGMIREVLNLGAMGVHIDRIYAQTDSRHIERLLTSLGFTQMVSPIPENKNFVLDMLASNAKYADLYRKALSEWHDE